MSDAEVPETPDIPITPGSGATEVKFTEKEERVLRVVWQCMKTIPEIDMAKLTQAAGLNTEKTCANTWGVVKKKLIQIAEHNGVAMSTPQKAKKSATPKKRANGDGGDDGESPTKKARKTPAKKAKAKTEGDEDAAEGAGEDEEAAPPAKKTRKSPVTKAAKKEAVAKDEDAATMEE